MKYSCCFCLLVLLATGVHAADAPAKPNLVIILMDDMGYGDIAPFNPKTKNHTPNLDRMASEGMKLRRFTLARCARRRGRNF